MVRDWRECTGVGQREPVDRLTVAIVFSNEVAWYTLVSVAFSVSQARSACLWVKSVIDRVMAGALGLIGGRLMWDAGYNGRG